MITFGISFGVWIRSQHRLPSAGPTFGLTTCAVIISPCSRHFHRLRSDTADACKVNSIMLLLRHSTSTSQSQSSSVMCQRLFSSHWSALVLSRLDYSTIYWLIYQPAWLNISSQFKMLTARLIYRLRCSEHIIDALISLHWLLFKRELLYSCRPEVSSIARHSAALSGVAVYPRRWYADLIKTWISHSWSIYHAVLPSVNGWMTCTNIWNSLPTGITFTSSLVVFR